MEEEIEEEENKEESPQKPQYVSKRDTLRSKKLLKE